MATSFVPSSPMNRVPSSPIRHGGVGSPMMQHHRMHSPIATPHAAGGMMNNGNGAPSSSASAPVLLTCTPSDTTVDYDENVTSLYEHIGNSDWDAAANRCRQSPREAATWVVRYRRDNTGNKLITNDGRCEVLWRFLPIHSACALNPPTTFLRTLLQSHPDGPRTLDDQGMLPLHYACGARCSREVLYLLLMSFPQAALKEDPNGMLPLHYLAQWGPSEAGVVDMVCVATGHKVAHGKDGDGNTAEMLARKAEYAGSDDIARKIGEFSARHSSGGNGLPRTPSRSSAGSNAMASPSFGNRISSNGSMNSMSSPSFKKNNQLSIKTAMTPRGQQHTPRGQNSCGNSHNIRNTPRTTTPHTTDKYCSFEGNEEADSPEVDKNIDMHECPEGNIEISLSDAMSPSANANGTDQQGYSSASYNGNANENRNHWYSSGSVGNNNGMVMTPRSGRAMSKLGVSPVHSTRYSGQGSGGKNRYNSWDPHYDGGLNKNHGDNNGAYYGGQSTASPRMGQHRPTRSFSWDQGDPTANGNTSPAAALFQNEQRPSSNQSIQNTPSNSGSTWTTHLDFANPNNNAGANVATAVGGPPSSLSQQLNRSRSTPRGFRSHANNGNGSSASSSGNAASANSAPTASGGFANNSKMFISPRNHHLPPKSPRFVVTPRHHNSQNRPQPMPSHQEQREPIQARPQPGEQRDEPEQPRIHPSLSEQERHEDQRLLELRQELSGANGSHRSGSTQQSAMQQHIKSSSGHPSAQNSHESGGHYNGDQHKATVSVRSGSTGSGSDTSYATQLTQKLQALAEAELLEEKKAAAERQAIEEKEAAEAEKNRLQEERERKLEERERELQRKEQEERERAQAAEAERVQREKDKSENALKDEIERLRADKIRAEMALNKIQMLAPIMSISESGSQSSDCDDGVSKLTFLEHEEDEGYSFENNELVASPKSKRKEKAKTANKAKASRSGHSSEDSSDKDDVMRLIKENAEMKAAIQRAEGRLKKGESKQEDDDASTIASASVASASTFTTASTAMTPRKVAIIAETQKTVAELMEQVEQKTKQLYEEKIKSAKLEEKVKTLNDKTESSSKSHSEAMYEHLQEVKSLRESLDKANIEIEKYKAKDEHLDDFNARIEEREKEWEEERESLQEKINKVKENCRLSVDDEHIRCEERLAEKEKRWNKERKELEIKIKDMNDKCWEAQNEEHKVRALMRDKELHWDEQREQLEAEINALKETKPGSDSFSVASTIRSEFDRNAACHAGNSFNLARDASAASVSSSSSDGNHTTTEAMRMRLETATQEAEDMRKFNTAMRKEHDETIAELELELEKERGGKTECLSKVVTLQYQVQTLEQDLEEARDEVKRAERAKDEAERSLINGSSHNNNDNSKMEVELYKLKDKLREKLDDTEKARKDLDAMKKELQDKEQELEDKELWVELKFQEKQNELEEKYNELQDKFVKAVKLQKASDDLKKKYQKVCEHVERLKAEKEEMKRDHKTVIANMTKEHKSVVAKMEAAAEKERKLQEKERDAQNSFREKLSQAEADFGEKLRRAEMAFQDKERQAERQLVEKEMEIEKLLKETERELQKKLRGEFQERERALQNQLEAAEDLVRQMEAKEEKQATETKEEQRNELTYLQQIRDLKKRIQQLQQNIDGHAQKLWEANKLHERALQDKEDECAAAMRELKKQHEKVLIEREDSYLRELRESKKAAEKSFRVQEESYVKEIRDFKKKEQAWIEREDSLLKQMNDEKLKDSFSEMEIEKLLQQKEDEVEKGFKSLIAEKDEEFEKEVAELQAEIKRLRKERKETNEDKLIVNELETQLQECKKELDRQRRKHKSEMNKFANTVELQKSKEGRLQSHIQSLEKQITDMVNDYESRLQDAFYDDM